VRKKIRVDCPARLREADAGNLGGDRIMSFQLSTFDKATGSASPVAVRVLAPQEIMFH
jgi:hypothetical protein